MRQIAAETANVTKTPTATKKIVNAERTNAGANGTLSFVNMLASTKIPQRNEHTTTIADNTATAPKITETTPYAVVLSDFSLGFATAAGTTVVAAGTFVAVTTALDTGFAAVLCAAGCGLVVADVAFVVAELVVAGLVVTGLVVEVVVAGVGFVAVFLAFAAGLVVAEFVAALAGLVVGAVAGFVAPALRKSGTETTFPQ